MIAICKRELRSYFSVPVGYVCIAALLALYGFFYYQVMLVGSSSLIANVYGVMFSFSMMVIPILTMRSLTEDRKNKTDQALLTAPVSVGSIVIGKLLACFTVFFIASTLALLPAAVMSMFSSPPWGIIMGNYIGTLLYGGAMISIGIFISGLTESQVISAILTFIVSIFLMYVDMVSGAIDNVVFQTFIGWISFQTRYNPFTSGIFSISSVVFFISIMAIFVFLTSLKVESRRWN